MGQLSPSALWQVSIPALGRWHLAPTDNHILAGLLKRLSILVVIFVAVNVKYIWPLQAPLADGGAQRKRLNAVRQQLGWQIIGCDYIECFQ